MSKPITRARNSLSISISLFIPFFISVIRAIVICDSLSLSLSFPLFNRFSQNHLSLSLSLSLSILGFCLAELDHTSYLEVTDHRIIMVNNPQIFFVLDFNSSNTSIHLVLLQPSSNMIKTWIKVRQRV